MSVFPMLPNLPELRQKAYAMIRRVLPELNHRQIAFAFLSEVPESFRVSGARAYTHRGLAARLYGPAFEQTHAAIVYDAVPRQSSDPAEQERYTLTTCLHEAIHFLFHEDAHMPDVTPESQRQFHGPRFIRAAIHAHTRATLAGIRVSLVQLLTGAHPEPSDYLAYSRSLFGEYEATAGIPLQEIVSKINPPEAFTMLVQSDLARFEAAERQQREAAEQARQKADEEYFGLLALDTLLRLDAKQAKAKQTQEVYHRPIQRGLLIPGLPMLTC